ncbi:hypothetical protein J1N35_001178 [Gossypium stocksii]|uniref:Putative plant transposon protein domain-containing protein n=1 Tax=Gossypium stocksii TaxID=47602 RepID=A0A9D3WJ98_9ROSI|nr:hypothetical protein J1N35_001178 [Gossypium stocksii]
MNETSKEPQNLKEALVSLPLLPKPPIVAARRLPKHHRCCYTLSLSSLHTAIAIAHCRYRHTLFAVTTLTIQDATKVIVRKKRVPLTSKSINDLVNLPNVEEDKFYPLMNNINWDFLQQVLDIVKNLGSQWIIRKYRSHSFRREYLKPIAKVWFYFVRYSFTPISHSSTISIEWMLLLYANLTEKSINVRKIILKKMHDCARKKIGSAYFPSLITSLCLRACVETQANLKGQYVQGCITNHDLQRLVERVHELNQGE